MANKITPEQIAQMISLYAELKTYSAVAKQMGISPSTVSRYIKAQQSVKTYSTSTIVPRPMEQISPQEIRSYGTLTLEEFQNYKEWVKEFK